MRSSLWAEWRWGVVRGTASPVGRERRDPHGGARAVRLVRELRAALPRLGRDPEGVEPPRRKRAVLQSEPGDRCATNCEAVSIDRKKKTVGLKNVKTGEVTTELYDRLVLSPGAASIRPPLPGIDLPGIFQVRTVPDARTIRE